MGAARISMEAITKRLMGERDKLVVVLS
jgi:hypothetical protein